MFSPKSIIRKKLLSHRSQILSSRIAFGVADGMCAGIQMQYTEMFMAAMRTKRDHLSISAFCLLTIIKATRFAMIWERSWVWIAQSVTSVVSGENDQMHHT